MYNGSAPTHANVLLLTPGLPSATACPVLEGAGEGEGGGEGEGEKEKETERNNE